MKYVSIIALLLSISFMPVHCMGEKTALLKTDSQHGASPSASYSSAPPPYTVNNGDVEMHQFHTISLSQPNRLAGAPSGQIAPVEQSAWVNDLKECGQSCKEYGQRCAKCLCSPMCGGGTFGACILVGLFVSLIRAMQSDSSDDAPDFPGGNHTD